MTSPARSVTRLPAVDLLRGLARAAMESTVSPIAGWRARSRVPAMQDRFVWPFEPNCRRDRRGRQKGAGCPAPLLASIRA